VIVSFPNNGAAVPAPFVVFRRIIPALLVEVVPPTTVSEVVFGVTEPVKVAFAGATEVKTPKPNAATVTSATRLKVVFVDICFLSISRSEEFPPVGFG
jgi:hypothetical protein